MIPEGYCYLHQLTISYKNVIVQIMVLISDVNYYKL